MKQIVLAGSLSLLMAAVAYAYNITHPNLKDAYDLAEQAIRHVQEAQQANKGVEFGGHGDNAIAAFKKAESELIEGDKYNDAHPKKPKQ
ncbi:MAG TPA: hypothetical protein VNY25_09830 [Steroidobacteraceae bacterium]|jgi:hypothetical protein|nr:hypothetical protein [Steroidobacteraceae bacterium]